MQPFLISNLISLLQKVKCRPRNHCQVDYMVQAIDSPLTFQGVIEEVEEVEEAGLVRKASKVSHRGAESKVRRRGTLTHVRDSIRSNRSAVESMGGRSDIVPRRKSSAIPEDLSPRRKSSSAASGHRRKSGSVEEDSGPLKKSGSISEDSGPQRKSTLSAKFTPTMAPVLIEEEPSQSPEAEVQLEMVTVHSSMPEEV